MNNLEHLIYIIQAVIFMTASLFLYKRYYSDILHIGLYILLFFTSIILALISAKIGVSGLEYDSVAYLNDAKLLISYIENDKTLLGLFFLTGGNSFYPEYYFPMLVASDTWSHYSSFTIEKFYLLFSYLSSPNLYSISIFFGMISFMSKLFLLRIGHINGLNSQWLKILILFLCFGGIDLYFVSSLNKENIVLFLFSASLYLLYKENSLYRNSLLLIFILHIAFLRFELFFILVLVFGLLFMHKYFKLVQVKIKIAAMLIPIFILGLFYKSLFHYFINKISRFQLKSIGNTATEKINIKANIFELVLNGLKSFIHLFYSSLHTVKSIFWIIDLNNIILIFGILVLVVKFKFSKNSLFIGFITFNICSLIIISVFVPNYGAQLRYRAPFIILIIFSLIVFNISYIKNKYM